MFDSALVNFIKKRLQPRYFPVEFAKFLRTPFFYRSPPVAASEFLAMQERLDYFLLTFLNVFLIQCSAIKFQKLQIVIGDIITTRNERVSLSFSYCSPGCKLA